MGPTKTATPVFPTSPASARGPDSRVYVIFTDAAGAKAALAAAVRLARGLDLPLELLAARVVPYPLPLHEPPVSVDFLENALSRLAAGWDAEIAVRILLCRDRGQALRGALGPEALVVIGAGDRKLVRQLRADGRHVIVIS